MAIQFGGRSEKNMEYNFSYVYTPMAENDYDAAISYISEELCNPDAASALDESIYEAVQNLCHSPFSGTIVENPFLSCNGVRYVPVKRYLLYYFPDMVHERIVVMRISHSLQDQDKIVSEIRV